MSLSSVRFLQISDLHLDSSLGAGRLGLPQIKRARVQRDMAHALTRAMEIARDEEVDVILAPGDFWDDEGVSLKSASLVYDAFASVAPIPVLVAPGNHDPFNALSYHHPDYYLNKVRRAHPDNVSVFDQPAWKCVRFPHLPQVDFYGCCFTENRLRTDRLLASLQPEQADRLNVALLHGSRDDVVAPDRDGTRLMTAPFSRDELLHSGMDYAALGHYHRHSTIEDGSGLIRGAYGGIPVARGLDESGDHFVLLGEIATGGVKPELLQRIKLDVRRILRLPIAVDASLTNNTAVKDRVCSALRSAGVAKDDIVYATLEGRTHADVDHFDFDEAWCDNQCFHLVLDQSQLEPEYDLDALLADETAGKRIEGRFAKRIREMLEQAESPEQVRTLRAALNVGMDALQGREVKPRHVY
ncbi:MAG: metallophosphoesterase family protein [Candidatus Sumerlaeaceae bacterium]